MTFKLDTSGAVPVPTTLEILSELPVYTHDMAAEGETRWSNALPPPALGQWVLLRVNGCGPGLVTGYFVERGYLGVVLQLRDPPEFFLKQNKGNVPAYAFGAEITVAPLRRKDRTGAMWRLVHKDGRPAFVGERLTDFRGDQTYLRDGEPPRHPGSTGHVYTSDRRGDPTDYLYPTVFDLRWEEEA